MEKKRNLKNRIFAGLLALTLAGSTPVLAKGENVKKQACSWEISIATSLEIDGNLVEMPISDIDKQIYEPHMHKYVLLDENTGEIIDQKWLCSEEEKWDEYNWTDEAKKVDEDIVNDIDKYNPDVEEKYYFYYSGSNTKIHCLYGGVSPYYAILSENGNLRFGNQPVEYYKLPVIAKLDDAEYLKREQLGLLGKEEFFWSIFDNYTMLAGIIQNGDLMFRVVKVDNIDDEYIINEKLTLNPYELQEEYPYSIFLGEVVNPNEYTPITNFKEKILKKI